MLGAQFCVRTVSTGFGNMTDQMSSGRSFPTLIRSCSLHFSIVQLGFRTKGCRVSKSVFVSCQSSSGGISRNEDHPDHDYLEASLLVSETILHHHMRRRGFPESTHKFSKQLIPFSFYPNDLRVNVNLIEQGFFRRFQSPTIFLKISCDADFLLPIVVGEFAIEKLMDGQLGNEHGLQGLPDQFQFIRDLVEKFGYEVTMVRITKRVVNTYFARLYFSKLGENDMLSVDARPSDAINVANRCKVPIYVHRQIVSADAIRIGYGIGRVRDKKSTYDVILDSATDGPDLLAEELDMVKNMKIAILEERYRDAAMWRDKLVRFRKY